jgi:hypothetical protein
MKHLEHTVETYVYSHCNTCNIKIYFWNIYIKHLQHTSETPETYVCNMLFQHKHLHAAWQMEARRCVEVTTVLVEARSSLAHRAWRRHTKGQVGGEHGWWCSRAQRADGCHMEVTGVLVGGACRQRGARRRSTKRAGWGWRWRIGQVGAARVALRVGGASGHRTLGLEHFRLS